jgi:two-component system chemotaxis sensor kinase CheA
MAVDRDDEILQDFLVEAGEILEQLSEQLVDLEQRPDDLELLNAVFRGFHTVKGGAGFLGITSLVEACHRAEDVFNVLRQGQRRADAHLMDVVLQVLDVVNGMFAKVREGAEPEPAPRELIAALEALAKPAAAQREAPKAPEPVAAPARQAEAAGAAAQASTEPAPKKTARAAKPKSRGPQETTPAQPAPAAGGDEITDDEFEALLDHLHGKGRHGGVPGGPPPATPSPPPAVAAAPAATPPPATPPRREPERAPAAERPAGSDEDKKSAGGQTVETTVRVDTHRLDDIMNMVGELVLARNRLATLRAAVNDEELANAVSNLDVVVSDLQLAVMKTRMQPIKKVFGRFPRVVRDLARSLNKEVDLELQGEETDLDKNLVEALADPLVHLVRNAVDHGIEPPADREAHGKPRRGRVVLAAAQEGDHIMLSISDDGRGMDPEVLRVKAVEKGMMDTEAAARLDDRECFNLIFHPGFSTKTEISDVSGRGVGMDVVKTRIAQMNGQVDVLSERGKGTRITIKLPLTLAILPTLMVVLGRQPFALPLASVVEIFNLDLTRTNVVDGQLTMRVRERALPLFYLRKWLVPGEEPDYRSGGGHVVVVSVGGARVGLVVDYLIGQEEVVIKPLGALLQGLQGMAGATITGDGKIALILDVPGLMRRYARRR